ncbi:Extra-large guanine nucleotide-binding protein 1 [Camellia lanceoleosa]|uniref:Extra-large guanine nucleotide-binding protein 1 n=1 Tax=Camellia lanceoleosa TaxID=1840588 RepID=A0ACC0FF84_9ERIC|nr:Extra-large guanine nucleotide-binding protein 1 [Camellia lanceoleosa]
MRKRKSRSSRRRSRKSESVLTEYIIVSVTSAATVTIAGVVREAVTILATYRLGPAFKDHCPPHVVCYYPSTKGHLPFACANTPDWDRDFLKILILHEIPEDARSNAWVSFDGKRRQQLSRGDSVRISMSQHPLPTVNKSDSMLELERKTGSEGPLKPLRPGELSSPDTSDFQNRDEGSGEFSDVIQSLTGVALGSSSNSHEHSHEILGTARSLGTLEFLDSFDKTRELLGSSTSQRVSNVLSLDHPSSWVSSPRIKDSNKGPACDVRRISVVTLRDIESDEGDFDENLKKGACYRCSKGNKFTEKEACIACEAKYCSNCVLRAMGSMLEGRKCVTCIGYPIDESKRGNLGKFFINGQEITKVELRMLQLEGVQCAGNPHFWGDEDSSYQEEGQKNTRGYIWDKVRVCVRLSLPVPSKSANPCGEQVNNLVSQAMPDYIEQRTPFQKLLLIGYSGSRTIFKWKMRSSKIFEFSNCFLEPFHTQSNVYGYLGILLEGRERFEVESLNEARKNQFSDESGSSEAIFPAATWEYAPLVQELWNNSTIQVTYSRRSELELLPSVDSCFLKRMRRGILRISRSNLSKLSSVTRGLKADDILRLDYEPSDVDIIFAEGVMSSNGLACLDFSFPRRAHDIDIDSADQLDSLLRSVTHPTFDQMDFLLILNEFDLFVETELVPLTHCDWFDDFDPVMSPHSSTINGSNSPSFRQLAFHYIAVKFKRLYSSLTDQKLYVASVKGLDP